MGFLGSILGMGGSPDTSQYMGGTDLNRFGQNPSSSPLQDMLSSMPQFQGVNAAPITAGSSNYQQNAYQAKDMSTAALPQYDAMRTRLNSQYSQSQGQAQDALDRQFAASGGGPGNGAQAKQTENLAAATASQKSNDLEGINAQEGQTRTQLQQQQDQMAFQSGEAQKGYAFQAGQGDLGRQFQANLFNAQQSTQGQQFNQQMLQSQNQFKFGANASIAGLNLQYQQAQQEAVNNEFNKALSQFQAQHSGGLLGGGGFLGTGIGA